MSAEVVPGLEIRDQFGTDRLPAEQFTCQSARRRVVESGKRTDEAEAAHEWSQADREELARLEALVAQTLKGVRTSSRILYQDK